MEHEKPFYILSIDGGGIRGVFSAHIDGIFPARDAEALMTLIEKVNEDSFSIIMKMKTLF